MSKRESSLFISKMADGDGLSLFGQMLEFHQPVSAPDRKKYVREASGKTILDPLGLPPRSHTRPKIFPKPRLVHILHYNIDLW